MKFYFKMIAFISFIIWMQCISKLIVNKGSFEETLFKFFIFYIMIFIVMTIVGIPFLIGQKTIKKIRGI